MEGTQVQQPGDSKSRQKVQAAKMVDNTEKGNWEKGNLAPGLEKFRVGDWTRQSEGPCNRQGAREAGGTWLSVSALIC